MSLCCSPNRHLCQPGVICRCLIWSRALGSHSAKHCVNDDVIAGCFSYDGCSQICRLMQALDQWEERLECLFEGRPWDNYDAALTDTVNRFPVDIQPFRDMIDGMRSDISKARYKTYDELYEYCYRVAGTVALMVMPVMGVDPTYKVRTLHSCIECVKDHMMLPACCQVLWLQSLFNGQWAGQTGVRYLT
jgi:hypothetical protein